MSNCNIFCILTQKIVFKRKKVVFKRKNYCVYTQKGLPLIDKFCIIKIYNKNNVFSNISFHITFIHPWCLLAWHGYPGYEKQLNQKKKRKTQKVICQGILLMETSRYVWQLLMTMCIDISCCYYSNKSRNGEMQMVLWTVWQFKIETEYKHDNDYDDKSLKKKVSLFCYR